MYCLDLKRTNCFLYLFEINFDIAIYCYSLNMVAVQQQQLLLLMFVLCCCDDGLSALPLNYVCRASKYCITMSTETKKVHFVHVVLFENQIETVFFHRHHVFQCCKVEVKQNIEVNRLEPPAWKCYLRIKRIIYGEMESVSVWTPVL